MGPYGEQRVGSSAAEAGGNCRMDGPLHPSWRTTAGPCFFHLSFCSAGGHAGFLLSQPLLLLARTTKRFSASISAATQERAAFGKFHLVSEYRSALTRLLALIFLVSTLFSAVIFLMFSWASFNLWKEERDQQGSTLSDS